MRIKRKKPSTPTSVIVGTETGRVRTDKPNTSKSLRVIEPTQRSGVWDIYRDGVTQGLLSNWLLCPEKVRLAAVEGLTQIRTGGALAFGSLVHDTLDEIYSHVMRKQTCNDWDTFTTSVLKFTLQSKEKADRDALNEKRGSDPEALQQLEENYGIAEGILPGYLRKWKEDFEEVEWLALEEMFEVPIAIAMTDEQDEVNCDADVVDLKIRGKWDGVYRSKKTGRLWLFETKTKGRVDEDSIMDRLAFDLQVMLYLWAIWKHYGEMPGGVVYNVIRKPQLKRKKDETLKQFIDRVQHDTETRPDFYYMRYQSSVAASDIQQWEGQLRSMLRELIRWTRGEYHWKNSGACSMGGVNCQFLSVCSRNDRTSFRVKEVAFPELVNKTEDGDE